MWPHSAHLLLITTGVYTLLTCMSFCLLFISSIVIRYASSSCGATKRPAFSTPSVCQQWETGLAGGHLSPITCEETVTSNSSATISVSRSPISSLMTDNFCCRNLRPVQILSDVSQSLTEAIHLTKKTWSLMCYKSALRPVTVSRETWIAVKSSQDRLLILCLKRCAVHAVAELTSGWFGSRARLCSGQPRLASPACVVYNGRLC